MKYLNLIQMSDKKYFKRLFIFRCSIYLYINKYPSKHKYFFQ